MFKINRRDAGYTIISRFEYHVRDFLINFLETRYSDFEQGVPQGIVSKVKSRIDYGEEDLDAPESFFELIDFPDLKEIIVFNKELKSQAKEKCGVNAFLNAMDELYKLRCKIAHIKGYFNSIDLDKLVELCEFISNSFVYSDEFKGFLDTIKDEPEKVVIEIPNDFIIDSIDNSNIIHNLPVPDYEYEGGFVGRIDDLKEVKKYLYSDKFSVVTISGAGGVGKTSLALKAIQELIENNKEFKFDAVIWLSAKENKLSPLGIEDIEPTLKSYEELLDTIIKVFDFYEDYQEQSVDDKEKFVDKIIDMSSDILIVIDNLETINDDRIINFILDSPTNVKFLITSRKGIGQVERRYELKELKEKESIFLFRQIAKEKQLKGLLKIDDQTIKSYVSKLANYPLAIKWVLGQVARGKDINKVIKAIHNSESDISKFCFEEIFYSLNESSKKILFALSCFDDPPTGNILQYVVDLEETQFEDAIEELILISFIIPEQTQNEKKEITTRYSMLPLTRSFTRLQLSKEPETREHLNQKIIEVENTITTTEKAKKEYKYSLYNFGATSDEEKVASIMAQTAFQKYQIGYYEDAVNEYKKAIKMAPNFAPIYRNWAVMESYQGHLHEAERLMEKASKLDQKDPQIFLLWGNIYRKHGKIKEAHKKYRNAYQIDPKDPIVLNSLGQTESRLGNFKNADFFLSEALSPTNEFNSLKHEIINRTSMAENFINWGDFLERDKDYDGALGKYEAALNECWKAMKSTKDSKIYSPLNKASLKKARLLLKLKKESKALDIYYKVISSEPKSFKHGEYKINAIIDVAEHCFSKGEFEETKKMVKKIDQDPGFSPFFKRPKYLKLQEKIKRLKSNLDSDDTMKGVIISVNPHKGFVIIRSKADDSTYIAGVRNFIPNKNNIERNLKGKEVFFKGKKVAKGNEERREAFGVQLDAKS